MTAPVSRRGLQARMALSLVLLVAVTALLVVGVGASVAVVVAVFEWPEWVVPTVTVVLVAGVGYVEIRGTTALSGAIGEGSPPDAALESRVVRLAATFDVPPPTVRVVEAAAPEAYTVGYRRGDMRLVVSTGLLSALDDSELEAVLAHELAHVASRDAAVLTAVATPAFVAEGLCKRAVSVGMGSHPVVAALLLPLVAVSAVGWGLGRGLVSVVSRYRERFADRAAARATGDPAALASALRSLDGAVADAPTEDLREASGVSALAVLPVEPPPEELPALGPDGEREPTALRADRRVREGLDALFPTHPPLDERLATLAALERDAAGDGG